MSIVSVVIGLVAAVLFFLVFNAIIHFAYSTLLFGLIALVIFFVVARSGIHARF